MIDPAPPERTAGRARRIVWPVLISVMFIGVLFVAVFPTRVFLDQRAEADERREQLVELEDRNAELEDRVDALHDDEAIELLARKDWGLVKPGEEAYAVVGLEGDVDVPSPWPFDRLESRLED